MKPKVTGAIHPGTSDGFKAMITEANRAAGEQYDLLQVVALRDGTLGVIYVRREETQPGQVAASFFD